MESIRHIASKDGAKHVLKKGEGELPMYIDSVINIIAAISSSINTVILTITDGSNLLPIAALFIFLGTLAIMIVTAWVYIFTLGFDSAKTAFKVCIAIVVIFVILDAIIRFKAFFSLSVDWNNLRINSGVFQAFLIIDGSAAFFGFPVLMFAFLNAISKEKILKASMIAAIVVVIADAILRVVAIFAIPYFFDFFLSQIIVSDEYTWLYPYILAEDILVATLAILGTAIFTLVSYIFARGHSKRESILKFRNASVIMMIIIVAIIDLQSIILITSSTQHYLLLIGLTVFLTITLPIGIIIWVVSERRRIMENKRSKSYDEQMEEVADNVTKALASVAQATTSANSILQEMNAEHSEVKTQETSLTQSITRLNTQKKELEETIAELTAHFIAVERPHKQVVLDALVEQNKINFLGVTLKRDFVYFVSGIFVSIIGIIVSLLFGILSIGAHLPGH